MNKFERDLYSPWNVDVTERWDDVDAFDQIFSERRSFEERAVILKAGLLNEYSYSRYRNMINPVDSAWWLVTRDCDSRAMRCVERTGYVGAREMERAAGVRPYCMVQFGSNILPGEQVEFAGLNWTVLESWGDRAFVLCDDIIARRPFGYNRNDWATSELRGWMEEWLADLTV